MINLKKNANVGKRITCLFLSVFNTIYIKIVALSFSRYNLQTRDWNEG